MLSETEARDVLLESIPDATIEAVVKYQGLYLFRIRRQDEGEENYDPFFTVDPVTAVVQDFDVMNDGDISEIARLFEEARYDV